MTYTSAGFLYTITWGLPPHVTQGDTLPELWHGIQAYLGRSSYYAARS